MKRKSKTTKILLFILAIVPVFCLASSKKTITLEKYYEIKMGISEKALKQKIGKPYAIHQLIHNEVEYEYIERLSTGTDVLEERHYFFRIQNGKVKSTRMTSKVIPFSERNSYDLQTTLKAEYERK